MAENSKIEWTDHTFNPWIGCQKVGPGCDNCYAEVWDARGMQGGPSRWGPHAARARTSAANWRRPLAWNRVAAAAGRRARVFCASLADVFDNHASILSDWRSDLWRLIQATPNLDWLLLTKRPGNIERYLPPFMRPFPNLWLGCTVTSQAEADRDIPKLLAVPAAVRFLSMEPLLGPVDLNHIRLPHGSGRTWIDALQPWWVTPDMRSRLDWIIAGGESGRHARPLHPDWARSLRDQCAAVGVPFLFKQWGEWAHVARPLPSQSGDLTAWPDGSFGPGNANDKGGAGWTMRRIGKKAAGRLLDGVEHNGMPEVQHV